MGLTVLCNLHAHQIPDITEKRSTDTGEDIDDVIEGVSKAVPTEGLSDAFVTSLSIILVSEVTTAVRLGILRLTYDN